MAGTESRSRRAEPGPSADELLEAARVVSIEDGAVTRVRPLGASPVMLFVSTAAIAAYVLAFAYPMAAGVWQGGALAPTVPWGAVSGIAALAVLLAVRRAARIQSGRDDLVINHYDGTLSLPWTYGRSGDTVVALRDIVEVAPAREVRRADGPGLPVLRGRAYQRLRATPGDLSAYLPYRGEVDYVVLLRWRDDDGCDVLAPVGRWPQARRAIALSLWLREQMRGGGRDRP
jgi:hypothetical protein